MRWADDTVSDSTGEPNPNVSKIAIESFLVIKVSLEANFFKKFHIITTQNFPSVKHLKVNKFNKNIKMK